MANQDQKQQQATGAPKIVATCRVARDSEDFQSSEVLAWFGPDEADPAFVSWRQASGAVPTQVAIELAGTPAELVAWMVLPVDEDADDDLGNEAEEITTKLAAVRAGLAESEKPEAPTESHPARRFLELLGKDPDRSWFRTIARGRANPTRSGRDLRGLNVATLTADNKTGEAVYFISGDADHATGIDKKGRPTGCVWDPDITCCRAVFVEWDTQPIEWQLKAWQDLNLPEPSLMVRTGGKSIHCYWLLTNPMEPTQWRVLQERLITHAGADRACKNPSRLMRLPGFYYIDKETGRVTDQMSELIHQSDATYSEEEIEACLQQPIPAEKSSLEQAITEAAKDRSDLPPRSEAELLKALRQVPEFFHNQGRREELLGLAQRLIVEWGKERAQQWLVEHSPSVQDMDGYFRREPDHISPGSIWPFLRERYGVDLTRHDLRRDVKGAQPLSYGELIEAMLVAAVEGEVDHQMELRAETIARFRRTDAQIEAALFKRHTELETGCVSKKNSKALDLTKISGVDWLVPGFLPANDLALLYGEAGTGKTTAALVLARAVLQGTGVLDHEAPAAKGKVLFIASDSGPQPLVAAMQDLGMMDMPEVQCGGKQRFFVWAADQGNESTAWSADLRGCIDLLKFVKEERIDLVVLDSCKAICRGTDVDYSNNHSVTALLTYFKDVVAPHTSLLLLNHDGTARNATAGAKSWKEIPSVVHQLQIEEENGQSRHERRLWQLRKSRLGPLRQFRYQLTDGEPVLCLGEETIGNCKVRLLKVLEDAYRNGETSLSRKELRTRVQLLSPAGGVSEKTIDNTLSTATRGKHPEICRAGRGLYKLAPRIVQSLKGSIWDGKEIGQILVPDCSLSISHRFPEGKSQEVPEDTPPAPQVFPPGTVGKSEEPSHSLRSSEVPPKTHGTLKGVSFAVGDRVQVCTLSGKWNSGWEVNGPVSPQGWVPVRFLLKPEVHTCFPQADLRLDRSTATPMDK